MQIIFDPGCSSQEYVAQGYVEPPRPQTCFSCRIGKPYKHGFYKRFYLDGRSVNGKYFWTNWGCGQKPGLISQEVVHAFLRGTNEGSPAVHQV